MIDQGEIRRHAGVIGVDPMIINHDYVMSCFLHYLSIQDDAQKSWVFKGGTSLAKCYFENYRFSEDLDFTVLQPITEASLIEVVNSAKKVMQDDIGIRTDVEKTRVEVIEDDYGEESLEAKFYYQGPWAYGGSQRSVRIHTNRDEKIVFPIETKSLIHGFSDRSILPKTSIKVYSLEEIFVEKLRALSGQRRYAISRDIFDIHFLSSKGVQVNVVTDAFEEKCRIKSINLSQISIEKVKSRKEEYRTNWKNHLEYLIPKNLKVTFDEAWDTSITLLGKTIKS